MVTKIEGIKITPDIQRLVAVTAQRRIRKRITDGRIKHPKGKTKKSGKRLIRSLQMVNQFRFDIRGSKIILGPSGPSKKYAKIIHEGGIITPKKAKFLAIPLTPAARVMKPRDFTDTFIAKNCIMLKTGKGPKDFIPIYALKKSVEIPAFNWLRVDADDMKIIVSNVQNFLVKKYG